MESRLARWTMLLIAVTLGGALIALSLRYLLPLLIPFAIAWLLSAAVAPPARAIRARTGISERVCSVSLLLLLLGGAVFLLWIGVSRLAHEARALLDSMLSEYGSATAMIEAWIVRLQETLRGIGLFGEGEDTRFYELLYQLLTGAVSSLASVLTTVAGDLIRSLPSFFLATVVCVLAAFFLCTDRQRIEEGIVSVLPVGIRENIPRLRQRLRRVSWQYLRAYLLLLLITQAILFLGLLLLDVPYALLTASLIALLDLLPVIGVGTVLIPWALILLIERNFYLGFGLLILYCVTTLVRQVAEPRLLGKSLGIHPLLAVFATYAGYQWIGVLGMFLGPVLAMAAVAVGRNFFGVRKND